MNAHDPNVAKIELVVQALGELREQLVFVGGCAVGLLLTDPAAAAPRVTYDVDLVAEIAALPGYYRLEREFSRRGFVRNVAADAPICRWRFQQLEVDLMPTDPGVLGFANRWYPLAVAGAERVSLPSGTSIRLIAAPAFMATKFEAFADRGQATCSAATTPKTSSTSSTAGPSWLPRRRPRPTSCAATLPSAAAPGWPGPISPTR